MISEEEYAACAARALKSSGERNRRDAFIADAVKRFDKRTRIVDFENRMTGEFLAGTYIDTAVLKAYDNNQDISGLSAYFTHTYNGIHKRLHGINIPRAIGYCGGMQLVISVLTFIEGDENKAWALKQVVIGALEAGNTAFAISALSLSLEGPNIGHMLLRSPENKTAYLNNMRCYLADNNVMQAALDHYDLDFFSQLQTDFDIHFGEYAKKNYTLTNTKGQPKEQTPIQYLDMKIKQKVRASGKRPPLHTLSEGLRYIVSVLIGIAPIVGWLLYAYQFKKAAQHQRRARSGTYGIFTDMQENSPVSDWITHIKEGNTLAPVEFTGHVAAVRFRQQCRLSLASDRTTLSAITHQTQRLHTQ